MSFASPAGASPSGGGLSTNWALASNWVSPLVAQTVRPPAEPPTPPIAPVVLSPEDRLLGHRSHSEWLVGGNPDAV